MIHHFFGKQKVKHAWLNDRKVLYFYIKYMYKYKSIYIYNKYIQKYKSIAFKLFN